MGGRTVQMIRIRLNGSAMCVPETSANKYALNVRFMNAETVARPRQVDGRSVRTDFLQSLGASQGVSGKLKTASSS
jgi:cell division FtsZ-interacting protein ZapD